MYCTYIHIHTNTHTYVHVHIHTEYSQYIIVFTLIIQVRAEAQKAGLPPTRESTWGYFVSKCANNLHIVMAMSPVGETLKNRCRNFPGLVNNSSIDWFTAWPKQALHAVASRFLSEVSIMYVKLLIIHLNQQ